MLKKISSTEVQNNFGRVLDDIAFNRSRYVVDRRGTARAVILGVEDFTSILRDEGEREQIGLVLEEVSPKYQIGRPLHGVEPKK